MLPQIKLDRSRPTPLYQQLGDELRRLILSGELPAGTRLPSSRRAGKELGISRNLVVLAYEQLQLEGYLEAAVGVGTWVPESLAPHLQSPEPEPPSNAEGSDFPRPTLSSRGYRIAARRSNIAASRPTLPFRPAAVAADLFPVRTWLRLTTGAWKRRTADLVHYGDVQGYRPLREALADHLTRHRAVKTSSDQILLTAGSQQSLDMIARLLMDPGDIAAMEDPGYDGAISALSASGAELLPVPVDEKGIDINAAGSIDEAKLLYTTPSHQYPLGVTLSLERRLALLGWAQRNGSWVIEDDYDSEFRYEARPLPALQGLAAQDRVVYVGTFSKVLASALRIGFVVLPEKLVEPFVEARQVIDHHPPMSIQVPLADFITEGHLERHIARMRTIYQERREALQSALRRGFGDSLIPSDGGLHVAVRLSEEIDDVAVCRLAFSRGLDPQPLSAHYIGSTRENGLVLGFGGFPPERLAEEVEVLRACVDQVAKRQSTS